MSTPSNPPAEQLAAFAAGLRFDQIPEPVVRFTENLLVDWFGSAVAGHGSRPVESIVRFAQSMGPTAGPSEVITSRQTSSPYLAALANAAASHLAEQDDVHNGSVSPGDGGVLARRRGGAGIGRERRAIDRGQRGGL